MAGYHTIEALRPILHRGPPPTPVVDRALLGPARTDHVPKTDYRPVNKRCPTLAQINEMIALRERGVSTFQIARQVGFARSTVQTHTGHVVVPEHLKIRGRPRQEFDVALAEQMWREGATYKAIAKAVGVHEGSVYARLNGRPGQQKPKVRRKYPSDNRRRPTLIEIVSSVTGIGASEMQGRLPVQSKAARARVLLQWLLRFKHPERSFEQIALDCGLTDHTTSTNAFRRVSAVIELHGINIYAPTARLVRKIWEAEWPKASR